LMINKRYLKTEALLAQTKSYLRQFDFQARKGLGQHFLVNEEVLKLVISTSELTSNDVVMEVGPGLGVLTRELARRTGWVVAIELDSKLAVALEQTLASFDNASIINRDILKVDPAALLEEQKVRFPPAISNPFSYKVVANLPYYITSPVLHNFLEASVKPQIMVVMVQKEVADAIVAKPGQMSVLSVSVQFYGEPRIISYVPAQCFYPPPEVDSAILRIDLHFQPAVTVTDERSFFDLVQAGFSASRKQIVNSLAQGLRLPKAEILALLEEAHIVPKRRAETLSLAEWARLWQVFAQVRK
jgi:16S rRNA (adenine1518-N6/adenine1519-N6)-dimethyltransferase